MANSSIIYQVYPRSFFDTNADGVGDLPGVIAQMPYLARLGMDYVWISPFFQSPMKDFGYDVSDYRTVDPLFGSNDDFDRLLHDSQHYDLKIMVDMVLCHTSDQHAWFQESRSSRENPKQDWYVWADAKPDGSPPNNWLSIFGGSAWVWDPRRMQYYLTHFLPEQPALNYYNPDVKQRMLETCKFWLDKGVRGFRLDVVHFLHYDQQLRDNPPLPDDKVAESVKPSNPFGMQEHKYDMMPSETFKFIEELRALTDQYDDVMLLGEVAEQKMAIEFTSDKRLHSTYFFNFLDYREHPNATDFRNIIGETVQNFPNADCCWSLSNHDFPRHISRMQAPYDKQQPFAKMIATMLFTLPGGACVYQGEELGLPAANVPHELMVDPYDKKFYPDHIGRDDARTPIPWQKNQHHAGFSNSEHATWLPIDHEHFKLSVDQQEEDEDSTLSYYRRFLAWRKTQPAFHGNDFTMIDCAEPILAYTRSFDGQTLHCYINLSQEPTGISATTNHEHNNIMWQLGDITLNNDKILFGAYSAVIFAG